MPSLRNKHDFIKGIPDIEVIYDDDLLLKGCIMINDGQWKLFLTVYNDCLRIMVSKEVNKLGRRTMTAPPIGYIWKYLTRKQQAYFAFNLDIFSTVEN